MPKDFTYVYAIQHNKIKKMYIGRSRDVIQRYKNHILDLKRGSHPSKTMQEDFNQFGEDYSIYILEKIENPKQRLQFDSGYHNLGTEIEMQWIKKYKTIESGYNTQDTIVKRLIEKEKEVFPLKEGLPEIPKG